MMILLVCYSEKRRFKISDKNSNYQIVFLKVFYYCQKRLTENAASLSLSITIYRHFTLNTIVKRETRSPALALKL